jgi:hypothetical protein
MDYLVALSALALTLNLMAGPTGALDMQPDPGSEDQPAEVRTPAARREGDTLDRFTAVAAVVSIVLVGVAGVYVYARIRKGL